MPRKAKRSNKRLSRVISNLMPHASSLGYSTSVETPLQHPNLEHPCAPAINLTPSSMAMPSKGKRSTKRVCHGTSNLMSHASSQGLSAPVESSLQPSKAAQPGAPTITIIPPLVPTSQNMVSASNPPSQIATMPRKAKYPNKRVCHGTSNLVPHASSQGHLTTVEPPSKTAQHHAPVITFIPPSIPTAQNLVSPSDAPSSMPRKAKLSRERAALGISNMPHSLPQGHSTHVEPPLQPSLEPQSYAPAYSTSIPPSVSRSQNLVSASDPPLQTKPRKAKHTTKRGFYDISNLMSVASSQGQSTHVEMPVQPSQATQSHAPAYSIANAPSIPTAQNLVSVSNPPFCTMPRKAKLSRERPSLGISNLMAHCTSHGNSTHVEPQLQPLQPPLQPALSVPTAQNLVSPSDPPLNTMPRKAKHSTKRGIHGISNLGTHASSQGHSTHVEPQHPSELAQSYAAISHILSSIPTTQDPLSPPEPPACTTLPTSVAPTVSPMNIFSGILSLIRYASYQGHSVPVESPQQPTQLAQPCAHTMIDISPSIPAAQDLVSPSNIPLNSMPQKPKCSKKRVSRDVSNLMPRASSQGRSIPMESLPRPSVLTQPNVPPVLSTTPHSGPSSIPCAHTITDILPSIPVAQDLVSPTNIPSSSLPRRSKRSKKRVSDGISNLIPRASSHWNYMPMESLLQPSELAQPIRVTQDAVSPSDPPSIPVTQDPVSSSDPPSTPVTQDPVSPSDPSLHSTPDTFALPTEPPVAPYYHRFRGREWSVQAIDEHGNTKDIQVTKPGVFEMPPGQRIVVPFDGQLRAYGDAATLLSGACGRIVTDSKNIPINFDSWPNVPKSYKDGCFNILKTLFHFRASEAIARRYCLLTMSRKYRNGKLKLWVDAFNPSLSREQLIAKVPYGIPKDQWSSFIDNHLKPEYQELCRKNTELRRRQTVPHTSGAKLLSRKQHEMEVELGRSVNRVELYIATHQKKDGSFVNEEARSIGAKLTQEISKCANSTEISTNDALAKVLGQDHCGRVRCLGLGGLQSVAFQSPGKFSLSSSDFIESSQLKEEVISLKAKLASSEEDVKTLKSVLLSYIQMKEGHIPAEFGALLDATNQAGESSGQDTSNSESGSSLASNRQY